MNIPYESDVQVVDNVAADVASRETNNINASLGLEHESGFETILWVRNALDDRQLISAFPTVIQGKQLLWLFG